MCVHLSPGPAFQSMLIAQGLRAPSDFDHEMSCWAHIWQLAHSNNIWPVIPIIWSLFEEKGWTLFDRNCSLYSRRLLKHRQKILPWFDLCLGPTLPGSNPAWVHLPPTTHLPPWVHLCLGPSWIPQVRFYFQYHHCLCLSLIIICFIIFFIIILYTL